MGLSDNEKQIIISTWAKVKQNLGEAGIALFRRFFEEYPSYQSYFPFRDVKDWETLRNDKRLKSHASNVMYYLTMMVDNVDDEEVFVEMIQKLARSHIRKKLNFEHFENLRNSLVGMLTEFVGESAMTNEAIQTWSKAYDVIVQVIRDNMPES